MTGLAVFRAIGDGPDDPNDSPTQLSTREWELARGAGHEVGAPAPAGQIVIFTDYQCVFCADAAAAIDSLVLAADSLPVRVLIRHFPLPQHPYSRRAALAAECAGATHRFGAYHALLFTVRDSLGVIPWTTLALRAGVADTAEFGKCLRSERYADRLAEDVSAARKLGITGTPMVVVEGTRFPAGWPGTFQVTEHLKGH